VSGEGYCFLVAAQAALEDPTLTVCHGLVVGQAGGDATPGRYHWHAWVESETLHAFPSGTFPIANAIDRANGKDVTLPVALYYRLGQIEEEDVRRYTATEAARLMLRFRHYGPWDEDHPPHPEED